MVQHKETVRLLDDSKIDVIVVEPGYPKVKRLKSLYFKIKKVETEGKKITGMEGDFDFEGLSCKATMEAITGLTKDQMDSLHPDEGDRIYNTYLEKFFRVTQEQEEEEKK